MVDKGKAVQGYYQMGLTAMTDFLGAISGLMAQISNNRIAALDREMQAELKAAGVLDKTQVEQAQKEYDIAKSTGTALEIEEKRRALVKAEIEAKYQKQKEQLQYEGALTAWKFQVAIAAAQVPMAILNGLVTGWGAGFPAGLFLGPTLAAVAGAAAGIQLGAVIAARPVAPTAQTGLSNYTVPDTRSNQRDGAAVMASAGETVSVSPRGGQSEKEMVVNVQIEDSTLIRVIQRYIDTGRIDVNNKNIGRGVFAT